MSAVEFVERWCRRAAQGEDCFDQFFSAWIALVVEARRYLDAQQLAQPDTDRIAAVQYFEKRAGLVLASLSRLQEQTVWLARRQGTATGKPILDVSPYSPAHLRRDFDELAAVWLGQLKLKPRWIAGKTAEMINHVRNNLFHGAKAPDDEADRDLLEHVNPILLSVLDARPK
jgi:hypothetical protein